MVSFMPQQLYPWTINHWFTHSIRKLDIVAKKGIPVTTEDENRSSPYHSHDTDKRYLGSNKFYVGRSMPVPQFASNRNPCCLKQHYDHSGSLQLRNRDPSSKEMHTNMSPFLELIFTQSMKLKCNHRFKCCLNTIFIQQYVVVAGSIHVQGLDVCVHFSSLSIILPIARCLPN
jgi:hypothetical protein